MSASGKFAQVPIEAIMDNRLTPTQFKVLVAIISFKNAKTGQLNPSRKLISDRCGIRETRISETTKELEKLGWIKKDGKGGFSKSCHYHITIPNLGTVPTPETVPDSGTVDKPKTVPNSGTVKTKRTVPKTGTTTVPDSGTTGVPKSGTRKEHTIEHRKEHITPPIPPDDRFDEFWRAYPRKTAKVDAQKKWKKLSPSSELVETIILDVQAREKSEQWTKENGDFIPYPSTYIHQKRWMDEPEKEKKQTKNYSKSGSYNDRTATSSAIGAAIFAPSRRRQDSFDDSNNGTTWDSTAKTLVD